MPPKKLPLEESLRTRSKTTVDRIALNFDDSVPKGWQEEVAKKIAMLFDTKEQEGNWSERILSSIEITVTAKTDENPNYTEVEDMAHCVGVQVNDDCMVMLFEFVSEWEKYMERAQKTYGGVEDRMPLLHKKIIALLLSGSWTIEQLSKKINMSTEEIAGFIGDEREVMFTEHFYLEEEHGAWKIVKKDQKRELDV